jgi:hypothetical protein
VGKFIDPGSSVDVILNNGKTYVDVKFIGFTKFDNSKDLPYPLWTWLVLEMDNGKVFIKPESVKVIQQHGLA